MSYITRLIESKLQIDAKYFLHGGFWLLLAQLMTLIGSLLTTVIFAQTLSENDFGLYRYIIGLGIFFSTFSLTGIGQAITQMTAKGYSDFFRYSTKPTIIYGLITSCISLIVCIYYFLNDNALLAFGCLLIAIFQPITIFFLNTLAYQYGKKQFRQGTIYQGIKSAFVSLVSILTILNTDSIFALLVAYFVSQAISAMIGYFYYRPSDYNEDRIPPSEKRHYIQFAKHTSARNLIIGVSSRLDTLFVFQQLGAASLAIFTIATIIPDQVKGSFKNILTLLIPKYSKYATLQELRVHIPKRSLQVGFILIIITVVFILSVPYFYFLLFPKYTEAIFYTQLLALSFPASIMLLPLSALQSQTEERSLYHFHISSSLFQIFFTVSGVMAFGIIGAVLARTVSQYITLILCYYFLYRKI